MILFRADGNKFIATGHIMRCLSIADKAREAGHECCFVLASEDMRNVIQDKGFRTIALGTEFTDMESESDKLHSIIRELSPELLILDSYYVTEKYMTGIRDIVRLAYIDDVAAFAYPADVLINYNIFADEDKYRNLYSNASCGLPRLLLGPQYAPLRKEFSQTGSKNIREKAEDILILTGGTDNLRISLNIIEYICSNNLTDLNYHLVVGRFNVNLDKLREYEMKHPNIHLHVNVSNMSELMNNCDIAVSASGTTLYELCACGIPTITYILADNQIEISYCFADRGIMESVGDIRINSNYPELLLNKIYEIKDDYLQRRKLSETMQKNVDPNGAENIIKALKESDKED